MTICAVHFLATTLGFAMLFGSEIGLKTYAAELCNALIFFATCYGTIETATGTVINASHLFPPDRTQWQFYSCGVDSGRAFFSCRHGVRPFNSRALHSSDYWAIVLHDGSVDLRQVDDIFAASTVLALRIDHTAIWYFCRRTV